MTETEMIDIRFVDNEDDIALCIGLRRAVFIDEQGVSEELEIDGEDGNCAHVLARLDGKPVAAGRVQYAGATAKIQRVCVSKDCRGKGLGAELIRFVLSAVSANPEISKVRLGAQIQALAFYRKLGFSPVGTEYLDAGIPHQTMEIELRRSA